MGVDEAREILLQMPGASEGAHHGHPDFRAGGKIFATLWPVQERSVLRLPPALAQSLAEERPGACRVASRSGGMGWLSVELPQMESADFRSLAEVARETV